MKKVIYLGLALGLVTVAGTCFASDFMINHGPGNTAGNPRGNYGGAGIVGSSHDLSGQNGAMTGDGGDIQKRICVFCHHPHNTIPSGEIGYSPLWNRNTGTGTNAVGTNGVFTPYNNSGPTRYMMGNSTTPEHTMNGIPAFGGVSLLCMSCHDGVTAMNAYSERNDLGATGVQQTSSYTTADADGGAQTGIITSSAALAKNATSNSQGLGQGDMSNHHPVGMVWANVTSNGGVGADSEIAAASAHFISRDDLTTYGDLKGATSAANKKLARTGKLIADVLYDGKMECVTCHDVHNSGNEINAERFLWVSDDSSRFCLSCHLK